MPSEQTEEAALGELYFLFMLCCCLNCLLTGLLSQLYGKLTGSDSHTCSLSICRHAPLSLNGPRDIDGRWKWSNCKTTFRERWHGWQAALYCCFCPTYCSFGVVNWRNSTSDALHGFQNWADTWYGKIWPLHSWYLLSHLSRAECNPWIIFLPSCQLRQL